MFDYDSDMDQCYICGEIFKKSFNLERCPGCRARITHNNPVKKVPKQAIYYPNLNLIVKNAKK